MNIPADIPSTDQENVYYSIKSLVSELQKYFTLPALQKIEAFAKELYLPTFVFDSSNAPNSFQIDVYPRGSAKFNILLDASGAILSNNSKLPSSIPATSDDLLKDGASKITLDASFHSESRLKSADVFTDLSIDSESETGIDLLVSSKFWLDKDIKNTLMQRNQYMEMIKSIVTSSFSSLPREELLLITDAYKVKESEIDSVKNVILDISNGQVDTLDTLRFSNVADSSYRDLTVEKGSRDQELKKTAANIAQSLTQLNNSRGSGDLYRKGSPATSVNLSETVDCDFLSQSNASEYRTVWNNFLETMIAEGKLQDPRIEEMLAGSPNGGGEVDSILNFSTNSSTRKSTLIDSSNGESWVNEWYYNNFGKLLSGISQDFDGLDSFLENYKSTLSKVEKTAYLNSMGGDFLLVHQAIFKSIMKLCQSNIDVSEFVPKSDGTDIFTLMGRSSVLGPSGCHQYPSEYSSAQDEYTIKKFSKTGFLCFQSLISIISKIKTDTESREFIINNVKKLDSDHDKVIKLWKTLTDGDLSNINSMSVTSGSALGNRSPLFSNKEVSHAYSIEEEFESTEIFLVPLGDGVVSKSDRSFINYNVPCIDNIQESEYLQVQGFLDGVKPLSETDNGAVRSDGQLFLINAPASYKLMGYKMSFSAQRFGSSNESQSTFSRNNRVHYGYINEDNWESSELENNVLEFFKQKSHNFPFFWASLSSIYTALSVEVYRELANSINDILDIDIELSIEDCRELFDNDSLWLAIEKSVSLLSNELSVTNSDIFVQVDGSISITDRIEGQNSEKRITNRSYRNTAGDNTVGMIKSFAKFACMISDHASVKIVENHEPISFDYNSFIPPESLFNNANQNFINSHGGFGAYIPLEFDNYYDVLEFKEFEFFDGVTKKSSTAFGLEETFTGLYRDFAESTRNFHSHVSFNLSIIGAFNNFKKFISGFKIPEEIQHIFTDGNLNIKDDIKNPGKIVSQIDSNKKLYSADSFGLSARWKKVSIPDIDMFTSISKEWMYLYVLGIKAESFTSENTVTVVASYIGSSGNEIEIPSTEKTFSNLINTEYYAMDSDVTQERDSHLILNYLHLLRGIDISETSFSYKSQRIYEKHITELESGVFPWKPSDFQKDVPKIKIDPIFNMSPWIYPTNYFYNVCISNEFKRVVGCTIKAEDLIGLKIDSLSVDSLNDIIGSIRWKIKGS